MSEVIQIGKNDVEYGERIGGGGFAIVYAGKWGERAVAIKAIFDPRSSRKKREGFKKERMLLEKAQSPNVVKLEAYCESRAYFMILELCDTNLHSALHGDQCVLSLHTKLDLAMQISNAASFLHSFTPAIIHRDIKPQNMLLIEKSGQYQLKLCDFGIANIEERHVGTPAYMAPELLSASKNTSYSYKLDIYAIGVVLWELIAERVPFEGLSFPEIKTIIASGQSLNTESIEFTRIQKITKVIRKCLNYNQSSRPDAQLLRKGLKILKQKQGESETKENEMKMSLGKMRDSFADLETKLRHR